MSQRSIGEETVRSLVKPTHPAAAAAQHAAQPAAGPAARGIAPAAQPPAAPRCDVRLQTSAGGAAAATARQRVATLYNDCTRLRRRSEVVHHVGRDEITNLFYAYKGREINPLPPVMRRPVSRVDGPV
jgi:hypothetical protein